MLSSARLFVPSQGYALLEFKTFEEASKAVQEMDGATVMDQKIGCSWALKPKPAGAARGGAGMGRGGRGGCVSGHLVDEHHFSFASFHFSASKTFSSPFLGSYACRVELFSLMQPPSRPIAVTATPIGWESQRGDQRTHSSHGTSRAIQIIKSSVFRIFVGFFYSLHSYERRGQRRVTWLVLPKRPESLSR